MDRQEAEWLLSNFKHPVVKTEARGRPGYTTWGRATLLSVKNDEEALIKPFGHKKEESCELRFLKKWNARTPGECTTPSDQPLTASIGEIMHPDANGSSHKKPVYTHAQFAEAVKLKRMGKETKDITIITGIPKQHLYSHFRPIFGPTFLKGKNRVAAQAIAPQAVAIDAKAPAVEIAPATVAVDAPFAGDDKLEAIRAVLSMSKLSHKSKCLMIEGLVSHD